MKEYSLMVLRIIWLLSFILPVFVLWLLTLGIFNIDIRVDWAHHIMSWPGWTRNEITVFFIEPWF